MKTTRDITDWLPTSRKEAEKRGWDDFDVILISGDAYVDHPSFGHAAIGRTIEAAGLRVGIVPQPNWRDDLRDFKKLGKPRLFFGVTAGCMDSMVNHYTANKRLRSTDAYTPGGEAGFRPDYATIVYSRILKELFPDVPVVIGGIEASLRRLTHYDYWSDSLKPSILVESGADLLIYGMGEQPLKEILKLLKKSVPFSSLKTVPQTASILSEDDTLPKQKHWETRELASHDVCLKDKKRYAENFKVIEKESNKVYARRLIQQVGNKRVVINPQFKTMTEKEVDSVFDLPYTRLPHPKHNKRGTIPAHEMIKFSVNMHRGCFGGCSFCTISAHQGKMIASRSKGSIMKEVEAITTMPGFKGYISDLGGPSANMFGMKGIEQSICDNCAQPSCIYPEKCFNLDTSHKAMTEIYREVDSHSKIKKAFVSSGIRYDLFMGESKENDRKKGYSEYVQELVTHHVSGRLKVAPEHSSDKVLKIMRKPPFSLFGEFKTTFDKICKQNGLNQQIIPYFISSHPGSHLEEMAALAVETKGMGFKLEQVQDFTPTPMTLATVIYYSGYHPYTLTSVYSAREKVERKDQNQFFFWHKRENRGWIEKTLEKLNRPDLTEKLLQTKRETRGRKGNK
ncbi:MAG: YgiQ family radical SAM protein [Proteobacteria bacterium]|nr:YgiQ family radical SAM protein [Pseudomonadota bacterium]